MRTKRILSVAALIALAFGAQSALAGTITTTYAGSANLGSGGVGYFTGSINPTPNNSTGFVAVGIGGDSFTSANHSYDFSATGQFNLWCVDILHWLTSPVTYTVTDGSALASELGTLRPVFGGSPSGATRVAELIQLADEVYSTLGAGSLAQQKINSAAFQLAVWAITYGTPTNGSVDTSNSGFKVDSGTAGSLYGILANQWLANLNNTAPYTGNYKLTYLSDALLENTQDMIVFTPVPEPSTLLLLSSGLVGVFGLRRKVKLLLRPSSAQPSQ